MTIAEKLLWNRLRKRQVRGKRFLRQYSVEKYVIDFYCPELKFAIEVDGGIHNQPGEYENDKERQTKIENYGIRFMRIKNSQIFENIDEVILSIEEKLDEITPPSPPL